MGQVKVYGTKGVIEPHIPLLSATIHACIVEALQYPADKKFQRFIAMEPGHFFYPATKSQNYLIIEISIFEGRTVHTKKQLIRLLYLRIKSALNIAEDDIEITIFETHRHNWGIKGMPGDELMLEYKVDV